MPIPPYRRIRRFEALLMVLICCAAARTWLIAHTEVIAKDGTTYVKMARAWSTDPRGVVREYDYHVGYPVAVSGMHWVLEKVGVAKGAGGWDLSGQVVSLVAAMAATIAVWLFAGMTFNWRIAWIAGVLFALGRKWSALGADVLSDALAVALQMWAVVLALYALEQLRRKSTWSLALAVGVGLCAGLGYLVRPEALLPCVLAVAMWIAYQLRARKSWTLTLTSAGVTLVTTLACALPYLLAIGGLTKKKSFDDLVIRPISGGIAQLAVIVTSPAHYSALRQLVNQLFEALHPLLGFLMCICLIVYAIQRVLRKKPTNVLLAPARLPGAFMMLAAAAVLVPLLMSMYTNVRYLSYRHLMFLAALLSPLAGAGLDFLVRSLVHILKRINLRRTNERVVLGIIMGAMVISVSLHTLQPLHHGKEYYRLGGQFVREFANRDDYVLSDSSWVLHYSGLRGMSLRGEMIRAKTILPLIERSRATYLVLSGKKMRNCDPELSRVLASPRFAEIARFVQPQRKRPDILHVYRIVSEGAR